VRVAILVAVVAAHVALIWLFPSFRRLVLPTGEDEEAVTPVFLPPPPPNEATVEPILEAEEQSPWQSPLLYRSAPAGSPRVATLELSSRRDLQAKGRTSEPRQLEAQREGRRPAIPAPQENSGPSETPEPGSQQPSFSALTSSAPDWRAQAEVTAQANAQHIVEAEDDAARKAAALTSRFKPLPGPRVRGPEFGWDYAPTHRVTPLEGGGLVVALNDRCAVLVFIIPMIGCSVGHKPPANGDLFKFMHPPVKFGDWDWRVQDP
jgi:hypothetical protein